MVGQRFPRTAVLQIAQHKRVPRLGEPRKVRDHSVQSAVALRHHAGSDSRQVRRLQSYRSKWYNITKILTLLHKIRCRENR